MPDWQDRVRRELAGAVLEAAEREEVSAELAAHLEEACQALLAQGFSEESAARRALAEVGDWHALGANIAAAKREGKMKDGWKWLVLPGLTATLVAGALEMLFRALGARPLTVYASGVPVFLVCLPWLASLPLAGALGAYLSQRAGAERRWWLVSSVFPILPFLAAVLLALPVSLLLDPHLTRHLTPAAVLACALLAILLCGLALLAGGLAAGTALSRRSASRS